MGGIIIILGLGSVVFLSAMLIILALLLRTRWDRMGQRPGSNARTPDHRN